MKSKHSLDEVCQGQMKSRDARLLFAFGERYAHCVSAILSAMQIAILLAMRSAICPQSGRGIIRLLTKRARYDKIQVTTVTEREISGDVFKRAAVGVRR